MMQDIWKLEKYCIWSEIVYSDHKGITYGDFYIGSNRSKVRLLKCIQTVYCLANFVYSLFKKNGSGGERGMLVPTLFH